MTRPVQCPRCGVIDDIDGVGAYAGTKNINGTEDTSEGFNVEKLTRCKACNQKFEVYFEDTERTGDIYFDISETNARIEDYLVIFEINGESTYFKPSNLYIEYNALVRTSGPVDFIIIPDKELKHFERDNRYNCVPELSKFSSISVNLSGDLPEGKHWFVIDNGANKKTKVSLEMTAYFDPYRRLEDRKN